VLSFGVQQQVQKLASGSDSDTACPAVVPASGTPSTVGQFGVVPAVTAPTIQVPSSCGEGAVQGPAQALLLGTCPSSTCHYPLNSIANHLEGVADKIAGKMLPWTKVTRRAYECCHF
jgi:hypothetical protein